MKLTKKLLSELQKRLKIGNRRGVHLNAVPANSRYKFDLTRLAHIDQNLPNDFIEDLLTKQPLKFKVSWKENIPDLNALFEEEQAQLVRITKGLENLINQTEAIESEKGINTFGFGFPILVRRDLQDKKITVAPLLIWSLRIQRTKEFNTWVIVRKEDDPIYINEVLINHLKSDAQIQIEQLHSEILEDGLITKEDLLDVCVQTVNTINTSVPADIKEVFRHKLQNVSEIKSMANYEKLLDNSSNSLIEFAGLFSIFEVQKQNIIQEYDDLLGMEGMELALRNLEENEFQPISSVSTDPTQQSVLHALETTRNILIQGPPGTGKSQTLTAILLNALENNKKTLVVCEKRTALEVLHNALQEKGLECHCTLIRDIIKDRKSVVDLVRERVDNQEYKRYQHRFSKESLNNVISQAKKLIDHVNGMHKKLDQKILGDHIWTDVVGLFLKELKNEKSAQSLQIDPKGFDFNSQELTQILEVLDNGQTGYNEYREIEKSAFLNPQKIIGDNPYLIEQQIHDDFAVYETIYHRVKELYVQLETAHASLRQNEWMQQEKQIQGILHQIFEKENEIIASIKQTRAEYLEHRKTSIRNQIQGTRNRVTEINNLLQANADNEDLFDEAKVANWWYTLLSIGSKSKRQTRRAQKKLKKSFRGLDTWIQGSKDVPQFSFSKSLKDNKREIGRLAKQIAKREAVLEERVGKEYDKFQLETILDIPAEKIESRLHRVSRLDIHTDNFLSPYLKETEDHLKQLYQLVDRLRETITQSKDIKHENNIVGPFNELKEELLLIERSMTAQKELFALKIKQEFDQMDLLHANSLGIDDDKLAVFQQTVAGLIDKFDTDQWMVLRTEGGISHTIRWHDKNHRDLIDTVQHYLGLKDNFFKNDFDNFRIEFNWFRFFNARSDQEKHIITHLSSVENWKSSFLSFYLNALLTQSASFGLPTHDKDHKKLDEILGSVEKEQLRFIKEYWFSDQIDATKGFELNNSGVTVANLYNKKSSRNFKRLSLRQIVQKDPKLFTTFFPIVFTTPDVASNLFKGMNGFFDIVMFDEASQLRLEDNLPALLKGKQIIIAGDEHQMPPSNYFSKVFDGTIDDEDDLEEEEDSIKLDKDEILLSCESLLDSGLELSFEKRHLDFHYRSRHPYLIDFSNYAFYNQRLKPLPNNFEYTPIKYIPVNGTFSDHTNEVEAERVLSVLDNDIHRMPDGSYPTVGIATFNIAQRNLIKSKILERQRFKKYEAFNSKIQELEKNGMFIKNLENIQGDERDVIILSTTYGIGKDGKFAQRFGPINHAKGYKLLNVIITRAKYKIYCVTSVPEQTFMNYKDYLLTEGSNNKRAVFYAYLAYCKAVSNSNVMDRLAILAALAENTTQSVSLHPFDAEVLESPFEEEVYEYLADSLGTDHLIPQMKFAGFRIDIVYDSQIPGAPKIAIECDGAKYHSSREAYLYDLHRQRILERHGFVFHRIWSTNWWRNPNREKIQLLNFIKNTLINHPGVEDTAINLKSAFSDDAHNISDSPEQGIVMHRQDIAPLEGTVVEVGSKVTIKYMNNGQEISVHIVDTQNNEAVKGMIQKIYWKSPLASSLLRRREGDIVKLGRLDNFVEITAIVNDEDKSVGLETEQPVQTQNSI